MSSDPSQPIQSSIDEHDKSQIWPDLGHQQQLGRSLLVVGWTALSGAQVEAIDIHLRTGVVIKRVIDLRVEGSLAQASTTRGLWTHSFALDQVMMVEQIPRGGRRSYA